MGDSIPRRKPPSHLMVTEGQTRPWDLLPGRSRTGRRLQARQQKSGKGVGLKPTGAQTRHKFRTLSSAWLERSLDMGEVAGSSPVESTIFSDVAVKEKTLEETPGL